MTLYQALPGQSQPAPKPKPWIRRHKFLAFAVTAGAALIAAGVLRALPAALAHPDYRDPGQLAQAVKAHEPGAVSAACSHLAGGSYICSAGFPGSSIGTYRVTVAPDGSSWSAG